MRIQSETEISFVLEHFALNHLRRGVAQGRILDHITQARGKIHDQSQVVLPQPGGFRNVDSVDGSAEVGEE